MDDILQKLNKLAGVLQVNLEEIELDIDASLIRCREIAERNKKVTTTEEANP